LWWQCWQLLLLLLGQLLLLLGHLLLLLLLGQCQCCPQLQGLLEQQGLH
jgi:hypothetical protein